MYSGNASEEKPHIGQRDLVTEVVIATGDIPAGSTFLEEDTGDEFTFTGEEWELTAPTVMTTRVVNRLSQGFDALLGELRRQTPLLEQLVSDFPGEEGE